MLVYVEKAVNIPSNAAGFLLLDIVCLLVRKFDCWGSVGMDFQECLELEY